MTLDEAEQVADYLYQVENTNVFVMRSKTPINTNGTRDYKVWSTDAPDWKQGIRYFYDTMGYEIYWYLRQEFKDIINVDLADRPVPDPVIFIRRIGRLK